jgi:hypothetical protein
MHTEMNKESVIMKSVLRDRDGFKDRSYDRYLDADQLRQVLREVDHGSRRIDPAAVDVGSGRIQTETKTQTEEPSAVDAHVVTYDTKGGNNIGIGHNDDDDDDDDDDDESLSFGLSSDGLLLAGDTTVVADGDGATTAGSQDDDDDLSDDIGDLSTLVRAQLLQVETGSPYYLYPAAIIFITIIIVIIYHRHHHHQHRHHHRHHHLSSSSSLSSLLS